MNARVLVIVPWLLMAGGCEVTQVETGNFPPTAPLRGDLVRGVSTRADVERALGHPNGTGSSSLPPDWQARDVWLYQSIKLNSIERATPENGETLTGTVLNADMTQQVLLVFFASDRYDGYLWYSNAGTVEAKGHQGIH